MPHHRKLTDMERRQIVEARASGTPVVDIARCFHVSRRTIYDTLNRATSGRPQRAAGSRAIPFRISERMLADFDAALTRRGIADRPAALRSLIRSADQLLMAPDPELYERMAAWNAELRRQGTALNWIAKQFNEAKLRGQPLPQTAQIRPALRDLAIFVFAFANDLNAVWRIRTDAMTRNVDEALADLGAKMPEHQVCGRQ